MRGVKMTPELMRAIIAHREQMLLAIDVWGPGVVYERGELFREIARLDKYGLRAVKWALLEAGMETWEVGSLMRLGHPRGCACWRCISLLQRSIKRSNEARALAQAKLTSEAPS
jgi:hypothetical protein